MHLRPVCSHAVASSSSSSTTRFTDFMTSDRCRSIFSDCMRTRKICIILRTFLLCSSSFMRDKGRGAIFRSCEELRGEEPRSREEDR